MDLIGATAATSFYPISSSPLFHLPFFRFSSSSFTPKTSKTNIINTTTQSPSSSHVHKHEHRLQAQWDPMRPTAPNSTPLTPINFLERSATVYGNCPSIIYEDTTYTWSDTYRRCLKLASSISDLGIIRGDVVSVIAPNIPAMYELQFAVPMAGAVLNNINTRLDARMLSVLLQHSDSKLVFIDSQLAPIVVEAISMMGPESDAQAPLVVLIREDGSPLSTTVDFDYEKLVESGDPKFVWVTPKNEWDPIVLNYTSGTTSAPKGVVHCHRGMFLLTVDSLLDWSVPKQPVYLWTLPMFHANGWTFTWGIAALGGTNICLRKFDAPLVYSAIAKHNVTHMCGAPVVLNMLSNCQTDEPLRKPVNILTAGAPPPAAVLFRIESLGFIVSHGYGLTETGGVVVTCPTKSQWSYLPASERARLKARQGVRTIGLSDMDVVDPESGLSVTRDGLTMGEVVLKGGSIMLGYLKDPVGMTKYMKEDGWFYTGDVGVIHPDGYLEIKDRSKDVIISGGENISSVEVESVLYSHPGVNEAAVVARQDEFWGETPCAFVSLKTESTRKVITEEEVIEFCKGKLPRYMVPKTVVFVEELPKTSTGKIQKFVLREIANGMGLAGCQELAAFKILEI